jgi:hypothetical protein
LALVALTVITTTTERFVLPLDHLEALPEIAEEILRLLEQVDHLLLVVVVVAREMAEAAGQVGLRGEAQGKVTVQLIILALQWQEEQTEQAWVLVALVGCNITFNPLEMAATVLYRWFSNESRINLDMAASIYYRNIWNSRCGM